MRGPFGGINLPGWAATGILLPCGRAYFPGTTCSTYFAAEGYASTPAASARAPGRPGRFERPFPRGDGPAGRNRPQQAVPFHGRGTIVEPGDRGQGLQMARRRVGVPGAEC